MLPTPPIPEKPDYDNSQFDPEVPVGLGGVMQRWVVPEGAPKDPIILTVPRLKIEPEEDEAPKENVVESKMPRMSRTLPVMPMFFYVGFFILLLLNLYFIFFKR